MNKKNSVLLVIFFFVLILFGINVFSDSSSCIGGWQNVGMENWYYCESINTYSFCEKIRNNICSEFSVRKINSSEIILTGNQNFYVSSGKKIFFERNAKIVPFKAVFDLGETGNGLSFFAIGGGQLNYTINSNIKARTNLGILNLTQVSLLSPSMTRKTEFSRGFFGHKFGFGWTNLTGMIVNEIALDFSQATRGYDENSHQVFFNNDLVLDFSDIVNTGDFNVFFENNEIVIRDADLLDSNDFSNFFFDPVFTSAAASEDVYVYLQDPPPESTQYASRIFMKFGLSGFPAGVGIVDANLTLKAVTVGSSTDGDVEFYRITSQTWSQSNSAATIDTLATGSTVIGGNDSAPTCFTSVGVSNCTITTIFREGYVAGDVNFSMRYEDPDFPVLDVANTKVTTVLLVGNTGIVSQRKTFTANSGVPLNPPIIVIRYDNAINDLNVTPNQPLLRFDLNWSDANSETGYNIFRSVNGGSSYSNIASTGANINTYADTTGYAFPRDYNIFYYIQTNYSQSNLVNSNTDYNSLKGSCIYSGAGDWNITCADNCLIDTFSYDLGGNNVIFNDSNGTGVVNFSKDLNNFSSITIDPLCFVGINTTAKLRTN